MSCTGCRSLWGVLTWFIVMTSGALGSGGARAAEQLLLELTFDGQPVASTAAATISCKDEESDSFFTCNPRHEGGPYYQIDRPPPGRYGVQVSLDANRHNPERGPGDYQGYHRFELAEQEPQLVQVPLTRVIHLTSPGDNTKAVDDAIAGCDGEPQYQLPLWALTGEGRLTLAWDPVAEGARYHYGLSRIACEPHHFYGYLYRGVSGDSQVPVMLPPNRPGEAYVLQLWATKGNERLGDLYVRTGNGYGWSWTFVVAGEPRQQVVWFALGGSVAVLLLSLLLLQRRRRQQQAPIGVGERTLLFILLLVLLLGGAAATYLYLFHPGHELIRLPVGEQAVVQADSRQQALQAELEAQVPLPTWWGEVEAPEYLFDNYGDIFAAQLAVRRQEGDPMARRRLAKQLYTSLYRYPDNGTVVLAAATTLSDLVDEPELSEALLAFALGHYGGHVMPDAQCSQCSPASLVGNAADGLAVIQIADARFAEVVGWLGPLLDKRGAEMSEYDLVGLTGVLAAAYWEQGERQRAVTLLEQTVRDHWQSRNSVALESRLERYRAVMGEE